jgi:hypothetical protein
MMLLALGGAVLALPFALPTVGGGDIPSCVRNANLVTFYQAVGDYGLAELQDSFVDVINASADLQNYVINPTAAMLTSGLNNWIAQQIPLDVDPAAANLLRQ